MHTNGIFTRVSKILKYPGSRQYSWKSFNTFSHILSQICAIFYAISKVVGMISAVVPERVTL